MDSLKGKSRTPFVQHPPACLTEAPGQGTGQAVRIHENECGYFLAISNMNCAAFGADKSVHLLNIHICCVSDTLWPL